MNIHHNAESSVIALTSSTTATVETCTTEPARISIAPESAPPAEANTPLHADFDGVLKGIASGSKLAPIPVLEEKTKPLSGLWQNFVKVADANFQHKSLADWSVNPVVGCGHGCTFCYVPSVSAKKQEPRLQLLGVEDADAQWGLYAFVRGWNEDEFRKSVKAAEATPDDKLKGDGHRAVMFSTTTDPYQVIKNIDPKEGTRLTKELQKIVRRALEIILEESTLRVRILTRSPLAKLDFDLMKKFGDRLVFGMSLPTLNDKLARVYEPNAPSVTLRLKTLKAAKEAGLNVFVAIAPAYPECDEADILATLKAVAELKPVTIYHEPINMRAENVARIQAQADAEGITLKTEVFASPEAWAKYSLDQLSLVERLAKEVGIHDRLHLWPDPDLGKRKFVAAQPDPVSFQQWLDGWWHRVCEWPGVNGGKAGKLVPVAEPPVKAAKKSTKTAAATVATPAASKALPAAPTPTTGLTLRTPDEILAMKFDPADLYFENGVFAKGQPLTILGPGGLGKSRLLLHLAVATILGKPFVGMPVRSTGLKWLVLQGENRNHRLQADMLALRNSLTADEWKIVQENLHIHTLEILEDSHLSLGDKTVASKLAELAKQVQPDVIGIDPLASFAVGSLNNDAGMLATCKAIESLSGAGGKQAGIVVLHHTLTGSAGIAKATGLDRGSYGRGSKVLNSWTRGQFNIAAVEGGDNQRLVIACGKNSNGPEFQPVGIRLNPNSMLYEVDGAFDLAEWRQEIGADKAKPQKATPAFVNSLVTEKALDRSELVKVIMERIECGKSTAYTAIESATGKTIILGADGKFTAAS